MVDNSAFARPTTSRPSLRGFPSARVPLGDEENSAVGVLERLERLVLTNASQIRYFAKEARGGDKDEEDAVEDVGKSIEEAYVGAIQSGLILSGEGGDGGRSFSGFDDILSNATSSQEIFARMRFVPLSSVDAADLRGAGRVLERVLAQDGYATLHVEVVFAR